MITVASLIARVRGWKAEGTFKMGAWGYPVTILGIAYGAAMLINIVYPSGLTSPRAALFNLDWITLAVVFVIVAIGAIYFVLARPWRRINTATNVERVSR